jgi:hypothetical protein
VFLGGIKEPSFGFLHSISVNEVNKILLQSFVNRL